MIMKLNTQKYFSFFHLVLTEALQQSLIFTSVTFEGEYSLA